MSDDNNTIDKMAIQFTEMSELKAYANAQYKTIIELNKKVNKLQEENNSLMNLMQSGIKKEASGIVEVKSFMSPEEEICFTQLNRLNVISNSRELNLEESKRVEVFAKLLLSMKGDVKTINSEAKKLDTKELLKLVENMDNGK